MQNYSLKTSGAFVDTFCIKPTQSGSLDGLKFAVKDNIDVAGYKTSYGSIPWMNAHPPAINHAVCVEQLLNHGATCIGKTVSDEFTYSLDGESYFFGTPINPRAPECIPGGSSSGSASAVACGLVDFALGTDNAGSIRVPASICGIWGMRPTTHRVSESGVLPFVPSVSTVGVLAKDCMSLAKSMYALLGTVATDKEPIRHVYLLEDAFSIADDKIHQTLRKLTQALLKQKGVTHSSVKFRDIIESDLSLFSCNEDALRVIQSIEVWNSVGAWIEANTPEMGPRIQGGLLNAKQADRLALGKAISTCHNIYTRVSQFMKAGEIFCFPTIPVITPLKGELDVFERAMEFYLPTMAVTSFAGAAMLPEITVPITSVADKPIGLSFAGGYRQDENLLSAVQQLFS